MKKVKIFIALLLPIFIGVNAQNNIGIGYLNVKDYELAKKYFLQQLSTNPAEAYYYLGEIAYAEGDLEAAENYYNQGLQTKMEPYCRIGLAKILLKKGQKVDAVAGFISVQKKYPKEIDILIPIGYAYLDNQLHKDVESLLAEMQKIDKKNPKIYDLEGDKLKAEDLIGQAAGRYDMALYFDPNYIPAYYKIAEVYEKINPQVAIEKMKELIDRDPNNNLPYRYLGRIYTSSGRYQSAIDAYKEFFATGNYTLDDIARYASALFFIRNYEEADKMIKEGLAIAPDHFVLNRLQMYIAANTINVENGLDYAEHFFSLKKDKDVKEYIATDYSMYALLLKEAKMYDEALVYYKHTISMDSSAIDIYKEMAIIYGLKGQNDRAADLYNSYIEKGGDKIEAMDYYQLGRYYYSAGNIRTTSDTTNIINRYQDDDFLTTISENELQKDSLLNEESLFIAKAVKFYLEQADKAFDKVIELVPEGNTGYLWKARTNSLLDPDTEMGLAKPYYEKVVEILSDRDEITTTIKNSLIEAYSYLGYFYYIKSDNPNTLLYWNKVLELDPENASALMVLKEVGGKK